MPSEKAAGLLIRIASKFLLEKENGDNIETSKLCSTGLTPPPFVKEEMALLLLTLINGFRSQ